MKCMYLISCQEVDEKVETTLNISALNEKLQLVSLAMHKDKTGVNY